MSNNILMMENRQLIPRWHTSRKVFQLHYPTLKNNIETKTIPEDDLWLRKSISTWNDSPSIYNSIDLYVRLIQEEKSNHILFNKVRNQLLENINKLPETVKNILNPTLRQSDKSKYYSTEKDKVILIIKKLKNIVREYPNDALTWLDLGFYYSIIGETKKAEETTKIANFLAPNNPFIARGLSRFLLHKNEPEKAIWSLKKTGIAKTNPLIASALLSINNAFSMKETNPSDARKIISDFQGNPQLLSELLASLGTLEIQNGSIKKGKRYFERALETPTENVLTQSSWLYHKHNIALNNFDLTKTIESQVNQNYSQKNYLKCRENLMDLFNFQPYSVGPLTDAGYISMVALNDPQFVLDHSDKNNSNQTLTFGELNNILVAKIMLGQIECMEKDLSLLIEKADKKNEDVMGTLQATTGMVLIKQNSFEHGCRFYEESIQTFKKSKNLRAVALSQYFYYLQIKDIDTKKSLALKQSTLKIAKEKNIHEIISGFNKTQEKNTGISL